MTSSNPFDILGGDDNDDSSHLIAVHQQQGAAKKPSVSAASGKPRSKPVPPAQAVREAKCNSWSARGRGFRNDQRRDFGNGSVIGFGGEDGDAEKVFDRERRGGSGYGGPQYPFRGERRGGHVNGEAGRDHERQVRRLYERRSGTGRGNEMKREGAGRVNWGTPTDDVIPQGTEGNANEETIVNPGKQLEQDGEQSLDANKENQEGAANEVEQKEKENKEMTLEEYEKIREEKRKVLLAKKPEERKVDFDKDFESMKQLSIKKGDDIFIQLGTNKDARKGKENSNKEERIKTAETNNGFIIPTEPPRYSKSGGCGRSRGHADHGPFRGGS
ncbi:putative hyaluronan/mRNA-binding protein [Dioscorea sansibarensis]